MTPGETTGSSDSPPMRSSRPEAARVDPAEFAERVRRRLGDDAESVEVRHGHVWVTAPAPRLREVMRILKTAEELRCTYFGHLCAVDWEDEGCEVIVNVVSLDLGNTVIVKVRVPWDDATVPSLTGVYQGADWHEREAAEMFGVAFEDHPNLVKLYLPEDFEGHPMRKSFQVGSRVIKPWPGAKDPSEASGPPR